MPEESIIILINSHSLCSLISRDANSLAIPRGFGEWQFPIPRGSGMSQSESDDNNTVDMMTSRIDSQTILSTTFSRTSEADW